MINEKINTLRRIPKGGIPNQVGLGEGHENLSEARTCKQTPNQVPSRSERGLRENLPKRFLQGAKKIELSFLLVVIFQIFLLTNLSIADSYIISQINPLANSKTINYKDNINILINSGMNLLTGFLSIKQLGIVSAQDEGSLNCCLKMNDGSICQNILSTDSDSCDGTPIQTKCEETVDCKLGCCYDSEEGLCSTKSTKAKCEDEGGDWDSDENCLISKCEKGCCNLGNNALKFITEKNCETQSENRGVSKDFRQLNEIQCLALSTTQFEGACITERGDSKTCSFETGKDCSDKQGQFYKGILCSHSKFDGILEPPCKKQKYISCVDGKDEIYWFDSCGNRENIYGTSDTDWGNGIVVSKGDSCGSGDGNIESGTCGNCARALGSVCASSSEAGGKKVDDGDFICKSLNCDNAPANVGTQNRKNAESWCLYDVSIGEGRDAVGSEHWKAFCNEGVVEIDRCGEYRTKICQENTIEEGETKFTMASCVMNQASFCVEYNLDDSTMEKKCKENKHCMIKNVAVDEFKFGLCVPRYPKGFDLSDESGAGNLLCNQASQTCTVYYTKNWKGDWKCKGNCNCEKDVFSQQMNDLCTSFGDCGSYINYVGGGSDNVNVKGEKGKELDGDGKETDKGGEKKGKAPNIYSWSNYGSNKNPVKEQYVEKQDRDSFESGGLTGEGEEFERGKVGSGAAWGAGIPGALGGISYGVSVLYPTLGYYVSTTQGLAGVTEIGSTLSGGKMGMLTSFTEGTAFGAFGSAALGAAIGAAAGYLLAKAFGYGQGQTMALMIAGGIGGAVSGVLLYTGAASATGVGLLPAVGALLFVILWVEILGAGDAESRKVEFHCQAWEPPTGQGNQKCGECDKDPLRPCTEYRCESLGQACKLLNKNEENPFCEQMIYETNPPVISTTTPPEISDEYEFVEEDVGKSVEIKSGRTDGCIQEWTPVNFILETDEYAQCKWSFEKPDTPSYEEMDGDHPLGGNIYGINHTFEINMPSIDSPMFSERDVKMAETTGVGKIYIRCQDSWENFNINEYIVKFCVNSGPDETAVDHTQTKTEPENNGKMIYGTNETKFKMWINEPADCVYDTVAGKNYEEMTPMICKNNDLYDKEFRGWPCETSLTNLINDENKFYIKCKDQPWETGDDSKRNVNVQDYEYILYKTENPLEISSILISSGDSTISNQGTFIKGGQAVISFNINMRTSEGANNGEATCFWGIESESNPTTQFYNTYSNDHTQAFPDRGIEGDYRYNVLCEDGIGNNVSEVIEFELNIDTAPPTVTRISKEGGSLKVTTNELAECYYSTTDDGCNFAFDNEDITKMTTGLSTTHTAEWNVGQTYYIKCADGFDNQNYGCAIKIVAEQSY